MERLIYEKLKFSNNYESKSFIQSLCEVCVGYYLLRNFGDSFEYEKKVRTGSDKNVDFSFEHNQYQTNIEVKCPRYDEQEKILNTDALRLGFFGRVPDYENQYKELNQMLIESQRNAGLEEIKGTFLEKHMDYNLYEFLKDANNKFDPNSNIYELNCLIVGCDDPSDITAFMGYMLGYQGLFALNSFADPEDYKLVDLVILTNLYNRNRNPKYASESEALLLENSFNLFQMNYMSKLCKYNAVKDLEYIIPNVTANLVAFNNADYAPSEVKLPCLVTSFVGQNIRWKGTFYNNEFA